MKTKTLLDKNGNPIQIEQSQVRGLKEALANVGGGASGDVNNKAKFIRTYYLQSGDTFDLNYNGYNEPLKPNQPYLIEYYNDEWGRSVTTFNTVSSDGEGFLFSSEKIMSSYGDIPVSISITYTNDSLTNGGIPYISVYCGNENFMELQGADYISIYELPFTFQE